MKQRYRLPALALVVLAQTAVLAMVYINAQIPLWTGSEILLATRPVDPRSLFRGNYARLDYDISRIPARDLPRKPRRNEVVYVSLSQAKGRLYQYQGAGYEKPGAGTFIRGRLKTIHAPASGFYRVRYGIEAYFAPREKAMAMERKLRSSARALVCVSASGKAALKEVQTDG